MARLGRLCSWRRGQQDPGGMRGAFRKAAFLGEGEEEGWGRGREIKEQFCWCWLLPQFQFLFLGIAPAW